MPRLFRLEINVSLFGVKIRPICEKKASQSGSRQESSFTGIFPFMLRRDCLWYTDNTSTSPYRQMNDPSLFCDNPFRRALRMVPDGPALRSAYRRRLPLARFRADGP